MTRILPWLALFGCSETSIAVPTPDTPAATFVADAASLPVPAEAPVAVDSDADGVLDGHDLCPGFDDLLDRDLDRIADDCDPAIVALQPCASGWTCLSSQVELGDLVLDGGSFSALVDETLTVHLRWQTGADTCDGNDLRTIDARNPSVFVQSERADVMTRVDASFWGDAQPTVDHVGLRRIGDQAVLSATIAGPTGDEQWAVTMPVEATALADDGCVGLRASRSTSTIAFHSLAAWNDGELTDRLRGHAAHAELQVLTGLVSAD